MGRPLKFPFFSRGTYDELIHNLYDEDGVYYHLNRVVYHYVTEGEHAGSLIVVYINKTIHFVGDTHLAEVVEVVRQDLDASTKWHKFDGTLEEEEQEGTNEQQG